MTYGIDNQLLVNAILSIGMAAAGGLLIHAKFKFHQLRKLFDDADDAWQDDNISVDEFDKIWVDLKDVVSPGENNVK